LEMSIHIYFDLIIVGKWNSYEHIFLESRNIIFSLYFL